jgi:hypothetical protein
MNTGSAKRSYASLWLVWPLLAGVPGPSSAGPAHTPQGRWSFQVDDDGLAFMHHDRDYTGGLAVTLLGDDARRPWNPSGALTWIDEKIGAASLTGTSTTRIPAVQIGLQLFTPQNLRAREPLRDDRPYASLLYLSTSELDYAPLGRTAYQSTLTFGFLGLRVIGQIQRAVHTLNGNIEPMGYNHQISAGGEPTLRYTLARYGLLSQGRLGHRPYALRFDTAGSIGYITEANAALVLRWGDTGSPWWESVGQLGDYAGQPVVTAPDTPRHPSKRAFEIVAGVQVRARLYNSFLQGQFRNSDVVYSSSEVEHVLYEAWIGARVLFRNNLSVSYVLRGQTKGLKAGNGARGFAWAGFRIARAF